MSVSPRLRFLAHPLLWILVAAALLRWESAGYFRGADDLAYGKAARDLLCGEYDPSKGFHNLRLGLIVPTAAAFAAFGIKHGAALLWPFAASLLTVALLYRAAKEESGRKTALLAALFLGVSTQHVLSGAELYPDSPLTLWIFLSILLYRRARQGEGGWREYVSAGVCFYLALATRIEAVKIFPVFAAIEALGGHRRGFDRRAMGFLAGALVPLIADTAFLVYLGGSAGARLRELFPAVEGWSQSPAARTQGLAPMLKSLVSPFGAFNVLFVAAAGGVVAAIRKRRMALTAGILVYLVSTNLIMAGLYRLSDGRLYTLASPWVAWFAAELLGAMPEGRWRIGAASALVFAAVTFVHARMPPSTMPAYATLHSRVSGAGGPVFAERRTVGIMGLYFGGPDYRDYATSALEAPCWVIDNKVTRIIDFQLFGRDPFPVFQGTRVASIAVERPGLPGFRALAGLILKLRGAGADPRMELYRLDR